MPIQRENPRHAVFLEDGDIAEFRNLLGPAATEFEDPQLPQLRRELWAWANFLLDLYESDEYDRLFDSPDLRHYDQDDGRRRGRETTITIQ